MAFSRHYDRVFSGFVTVMYYIYVLIESTDCIAAYILNFMHVIHVRTVYIHIASLIAINRNQIQCCHAVNFTLSSCMVGSVPVTYTLYMEARK